MVGVLNNGSLVGVSVTDCNNGPAHALLELIAKSSKNDSRTKK